MKRYLPLFLPLMLVACAPGLSSVIVPPSFRVVEAGTALVRLEPAGVGSGVALIHLELEAANSNPFAVRIDGLDGDLFLGGRRVASSSFRDGVFLPARGSARLGLDVEVPVEGGTEVLAQLARLLAGDAVPYRLDATVTLDVLGAPQRLPSVTVAQGDLRAPSGLRPPGVRFDSSATRVRLSGLNVQVDVALVFDNPLPLGYFVRAPEVTLRLDGRPVGTASLPRVPVPAASSAMGVIRFDLGLAEVGAGMLARLQGGAAGLRVAVAGDLAVEIPGVASAVGDLAGVGGLLP